jgi:hypothetical protein
VRDVKTLQQRFGPRPPRDAVVVALAAALSVFVLPLAATAASTREAAAPLPGTYNGHVSTNAGHGLPPQGWIMSVAHATCAPPGGGKPRLAWCVTVSLQSTIQMTCADGSITEPFFPVSEPIALSSAGTISHQYTFYYSSSSNQNYEHHVAGSVKVAALEFVLKVDGRGNATGTAHYTTVSGGGGACDSKVVKITAKRGG